MSQLSSALASGPCAVFKAKSGREYPVGYKTQKVKAAFCTWLEERARERLLARKEKEEWPRARWERACDALEDDLIAGKYEYDSELVHKSLQTPLGSLKMASLLFSISIEEMRDLAAESHDEIELILRKVELESAPRKPAGNAERPVAPPAEESTGKSESTSMPSSPP